MTLDQLQSFRAIIETGSFRGAAARVHRTQPAVTHQIKALEREMGHALIDRKTASPTPAGSLFYAQACKLLTDADAMQAAMRDFDETAASELRLGTSDTTALYVLPTVVQRFRRKQPRARLHIVNRPTETIATLVERGDLDLGIVTLPTGLAALEERVLFKQELVLVVPKAHALTKRSAIRLRDLMGEPLLLLEDVTRTGRLLRDYFAERDFAPNVVLDTSSFEVIKRYVAEGIGISFLPKETITPRDIGLAVLPFSGLPRVTIGPVWRKGAYRTRAAQAFMKLF